MLEVWRHTGGVFPTSAGFALKGLSHYWNDRRGYAASDCIVAPTELLAMQLRSLGLKAVVCPPPSHRPKSASRAGKGNGHGPGRKRRITVVCGDLDHPRKNVRTGIQAVHRLAAAGVDVSLELIGRNVEALSAVLAALPASVAVDAPGLLPRDQIQGRLMDSDVLLLPSLYEEWGYVATEALIVGTPVVAFPVYPFIEILSPPLGACASDMSPGALAQSLAQVLEDDASRPLVASLAAQRFGEDAVGRMLSGIWSGDAAPERETLAAAGRR
jgi:glycosyltransferase involved in cell wall biosynthesis